MNEHIKAQLRKKFTALGHMPIAETAKATDAVCERIASVYRATAPVDTGELVASVEVEKVGEHNRFSGTKNLTSAVVVNSDHAAAVEYGTRYMPANPVFRRAIAQAGSKVKVRAFVKEGLARGVTKAGKV